MALVILSGYPCAGKTSRALEIKKMIETRMSENNEITTKEVMILNDEMMGLTRSLYIGESVLSSEASSRMSTVVSDGHMYKIANPRKSLAEICYLKQFAT